MLRYSVVVITKIDGKLSVTENFYNKHDARNFYNFYKHESLNKMSGGDWKVILRKKILFGWGPWFTLMECGIGLR